MSEAEYVESTIVRQLRGVCEKYRDHKFTFGVVNIADMARDCANEIERLERENAALRAQEAREPMTCEGCVQKASYCESCVRGEYSGDYYKPAHEPKGAHQSITPRLQPGACATASQID